MDFPILETPVYSIYNWNKHRRHKTPEEFKNQDSLLAEQVVKLNFKVKEINDNINSHSA
jgi:5'-3' exonuclease